MWYALRSKAVEEDQEVPWRHGEVAWEHKLQGTHGATQQRLSCCGHSSRLELVATITCPLVVIVIIQKNCMEHIINQAIFIGATWNMENFTGDLSLRLFIEAEQVRGCSASLASFNHKSLVNLQAHCFLKKEIIWILLTPFPDATYSWPKRTLCNIESYRSTWCYLIIWKL